MQDKKSTPLNYTEIIELWNSGTDEYNQWDSLGEEEKIEFTIRITSENWVVRRAKTQKVSAPEAPTGGQYGLAWWDGTAVRFTRMNEISSLGVARSEGAEVGDMLRSWDGLRCAIGGVITAQPHGMTAAVERLEAAKKDFEVKLWSVFVNGDLAGKQKPEKEVEL